jgi:hypothetical protein
MGHPDKFDKELPEVDELLDNADQEVLDLDNGLTERYLKFARTEIKLSRNGINLASRGYIEQSIVCVGGMRVC